MTIFEILSISEQSTWKELNDAYQREKACLASARLDTPEEAQILSQKRDELERAYEASRERYQNGPIAPVTATTYLKKLGKSQAATLYGIPGPCYLVSSGLDYCISDDNSCCSCSCCYDMNCCGNCYEGCEVLSWLDTAIMVLAGLAAAGAVLMGIYKGVSSTLTEKRNRERESLRSRRRALEGEIQQSKDAVKNFQRLELVVEALKPLPSGEEAADRAFREYTFFVEMGLIDAEARVKQLEEERAKVDRKLARN